jgi:hypothetical protein
MAPFTEKQIVELVNPCVAIDRAGRLLVPLFKNGQPYAPWVPAKAMIKATTLGVLPAGALYHFEGFDAQDDQVAVVNDGHEYYATPLWNLRPQTQEG